MRTIINIYRNKYYYVDYIIEFIATNATEFIYTCFESHIPRDIISFLQKSGISFSTDQWNISSKFYSEYQCYSRTFEVYSGTKTPPYCVVETFSVLTCAQLVLKFRLSAFITAVYWCPFVCNKWLDWDKAYD